MIEWKENDGNGWTASLAPNLEMSVTERHCRWHFVVFGEMSRLSLATAQEAMKAAELMAISDLTNALMKFNSAVVL